MIGGNGRIGESGEADGRNAACPRGNASPDSLLPPENGTAAGEAGGGYRTALRRDQRSRRRRRSGLAVVAALLLAAASLAAAWRWDSVKGAARWLEERARGSRADGKPPGGEGAGDFLVNPLTGQEIRDASINTLVCLTEEGEVRALLRVSWAEGAAAGCFILPEGIVGKDQDGTDLSLARALSAKGERTQSLRYMVEGLTGQPVHYVAAIPLKSLLILAEETGFPPVRVARDCEVLNPFTKARESLAAGQVLKDTDRVLAYLLAEGGPDEYAERCERGRAYLPEVLGELAGWPAEALSEALRNPAAPFQLSPAPSGEGGNADYLASLAAAWSRGSASGIAFYEAPRIEVLNGCGVVGAGSAAKAMLESRGYEVAEAGRNAKVVEGGQEFNDFSHQASTLRYAPEDPLVEAYAKYLAMLFKIPKVECCGEREGITLIVGSDLAVTLVGP